MKSYRSRVDSWVVGILAGAVMSLLAIGLRLLSSAPRVGLLLLSLATFVGVLVVALGVPCLYILHDDYLLIRSGFLQWRVPYSKITAVELSHSPFSAPAWSLHRVKITYKNKLALISPVNREEFVEELREKVDTCVIKC